MNRSLVRSLPSAGALVALTLAVANGAFAGTVTTYSAVATFNTATAPPTYVTSLINFNNETTGNKGQDYDYDPSANLMSAHADWGSTTIGTTGGGSKALEISTSAINQKVTFTFDPGLVGFGADFSGVNISGAQGTVTVEFNDGSSQAIALNNAFLNGGGGGFFGFLDSGLASSQYITSISLDMQGTGSNNQSYLMDNVRLVRAVPEPGMMVTGLSMVGMTGLGLLRGRRRRANAAEA